MLRECARCGTMQTDSNMATFVDDEIRYYCHPVMHVNDDTCFILSQQERMDWLLKMSQPDQAEQPLPTVNDAPYIQDQLMEYIERRKQHGIETYGSALQPHNGRDALRDLFEELIDAVMYTGQLLVERDGVLPQ